MMAFYSLNYMPKLVLWHSARFLWKWHGTICGSDSYGYDRGLAMWILRMFAISPFITLQSFS